MGPAAGVLAQMDVDISGWAVVVLVMFLIAVPAVLVWLVLAIGDAWITRNLPRPQGPRYTEASDGGWRASSMRPAPAKR